MTKLRIALAIGLAFFIGWCFARNNIDRTPTYSIGKNLQTDLKYQIIFGDPWGDFDEKVFRLCQEVQSDLDARNAYLWAQNQIWEYRRSEAILRPMVKPLTARKFCVTIACEVATTDKRMSFAIMPISPLKVTTALEQSTEYAQSMEVRRAKEWAAWRDEK